MPRKTPTASMARSVTTLMMTTMPIWFLSAIQVTAVNLIVIVFVFGDRHAVVVVVGVLCRARTSKNLLETGRYSTVIKQIVFVYIVSLILFVFQWVLCTSSLASLRLYELCELLRTNRSNWRYLKTNVDRAVFTWASSFVVGFALRCVAVGLKNVFIFSTNQE